MSLFIWATHWYISNGATLMHWDRWYSKGFLLSKITQLMLSVLCLLWNKRKQNRPKMDGKSQMNPGAAWLFFTFTVVRIAYWCSQRLPVAPQCVWRYINVAKYQALVIVTANGEWILSTEHYCWIATYRALKLALSLDNPAGVDRIELWFLLALSCRATCIEVSNCFFTFYV